MVSKINKRLEEHKESVSRSRTSSLWFQYLDMVAILKKSIKAKRTGRFDLHLQSVAFFFAAAGHHNYAKSARLYLQQMMALKDTHPKVYQDYQEGHHVFQRSDRYWAGLSQDLVIEQVLMRSLKTSGGLTRGTGFGERQRLVWLLSMPACAEINSAMQTLSGVTFTTLEQHKETGATRQARDHKDTQTLVSYLTDRSPFLSDPSLRSIASGRVADDTAKVDDAKNIGKKILDGMTEQNVPEVVIRKKGLAVTLATKLAVRVNDEPIVVDPLVLFQRLLKTAQSTPETIPSLFKYELTNLPCALFDASGLPRQASKSTLAEYLWSSAKEETTLPNENIHFVLDGGSLLHKLPWQRGSTYNQLAEMYAEFVAQKYKNATIVFDGYSTQQTTKAATHVRRHGTSVQVNFTGDMILQDAREKFLANPSNKQRFINLLSETLMKLGFQIHHAKDDADCLIVKTTPDVAASSTTVLIGEDTDILVLLLYHVTDNHHGVYFMPSGRKAKLWDIKTARAKIGTETCKRLLFAHAISGCDTTSMMMNIGKSLPVKLLRKSTLFQKIADVFMAANSHQETEEAGEKAVVLLYGGEEKDSLNHLRYVKYVQKVAISTKSFQPSSLPPSSSAAKYHCFHVYFQVQAWENLNNASLDPRQWGWEVDNRMLLHMLTDLPAAPEELLTVIRCNCKTDCSTTRCTCRKHGLVCTVACGHCRGETCVNVAPVNQDYEQDDEIDEEQ